MPKVIEGKNMVMVEEKAGEKATKIRKAKPSDVKHVPTKDKPRIATKIRDSGFRESSIKSSKRLD